MKKLAFHKPGRRARDVLRVNLFITTLFAVALLLSFLQEIENGNLFCYLQYMDYLEYIFAGVLISAGGFVLVEAIDAEQKNIDK